MVVLTLVRLVLFKSPLSIVLLIEEFIFPTSLSLTGVITTNSFGVTATLTTPVSITSSSNKDSLVVFTTSLVVFPITSGSLPISTVLLISASLTKVAGVVVFTCSIKLNWEIFVS